MKLKHETSDIRFNNLANLPYEVSLIIIIMHSNFHFNILMQNIELLLGHNLLGIKYLNLQKA